ncbi:MFS transporter [Amycolatopsis sp. K13G38]|uniref:MFS transporter n=1 Tax=Amycolatopsis acididurans TaxID=2724524 RepID=A0ABX1J8V3_9PSEU|nr:MFS transporter [Amycolatopsis acididurans]NKQ56099.1 MFS transporter [Amycolatopsis acididurans]
MSESATRAVEHLSARLDRLPVATKSHKRWIGLLALFFFFDNFDIVAFSNTAPAMKSEWGLTVGELALATATPFIGMFVGSVVGGRLADLYGRRPVMLIMVVFYSVLTLAIAAAPNIETVAVLRGIAGFGLQAFVGLALVFVSEVFPRHLRGRYMGMVLTLATISLPVSGLLSRVIVPQGAGMWRWIFVIGALAVVGVIYGMVRLPESPRWLILRGRTEQAERVVSALEDEARAATGAELPPPVVEAPVSDGSLRELLKPLYVKRISVASIVTVGVILVLYGFGQWLPTLLVEQGYSASAALTTYTIISSFYVVGAFLAYLLVDHIERKTFLVVLATIMAAGLVVFGFVDSPVVTAVIGCVVALVLQTCLATMYVYSPEIFPTHLRGVGSGLTNGLGRLAGFAGAFIIAAIFSAFGFTAVFFYLAIVSLVFGLILFLLGERTTKRGLEAISEGATLADADAKTRVRKEDVQPRSR